MKRILAVLAVFILLGLGVAGWVLAGPATAFQRERYFLYVRTGMDFESLMGEIRKDTVLRVPAAFSWVANRMDYPQNMKAGRYEIKSGASLLSILHMLEKGRQSPVNLVITKLRTREDLAGLVGKKLECDSNSFIQFLLDNDSLRSFHLDSNTVMTAVLPNTYSYYWNTTPDKVFKKLYAAYSAYWNEERRQQAAAHGLTPTTAYIVASIVEEETNRKEDKGKVTSVYLNRLQKGMRLAADPTVKFALHNFELKRIYEKYLQVESPYNTYKYAGLPPGPICTPAPETLEAVLTSPKTDYIYFVAKPDFSGYSNFAATYQEHLVFAHAYQQSLDEQMKIGEANKKAGGK